MSARLQRLIAQLGRQDAGRSIAPQPVTVGPDPDVPPAQLSKKGYHAHTSISSRLPVPSVGAFGCADHDGASMT